jgi:hypothetical protein
VRYWDASCLVPLCTAERTSPALRALAAKGPIVTWCLSSVEIASAIERRTRERHLSGDGRRRALENLQAVSAAWIEVTAFASVRERALALLARHSLRAADAVQLGAALVAAGGPPSGHEFLCGDARLRDAAIREGFVSPRVEQS